MVAQSHEVAFELDQGRPFRIIKMGILLIPFTPLIHHQANCKKQPECEICHKKFKGPGMLKMHMKTHEKRLLHCELCLKNFQNEYHLNLHMEKHNSVDSNSFKCEPCNRVFISANDLRVRLKGHSLRLEI